MIDLRSPEPVRVTVRPPDPAGFTLAALAEVAATLPPERVEHHRAVDLPDLLPDGKVTRDPRPVAEVIADLDRGDSWVMLTGLASREPYRSAALQVGAPLQLAARVAGETPTTVDLIVFLGAARTRVPFHCDVGHHVLLQLEGTKTLAVGWYDDPEVEQAMRAVSVGRNRANPDRLPDRIEEIVLDPGDAVALPAFCFHAVTDCSGRSRALTAVLRTDVTEATAAALEARRAADPGGSPPASVG
ncbi:MAG: hypothetical protein FJW77_04110 [Actinobacteria bacterium]|nr:hypothetical protein [Actinomycetota bacterium]